MWLSDGCGFVKSLAHPHVIISSPVDDIFIIYLISVTVTTGQIRGLLSIGRHLNPGVEWFSKRRKNRRKNTTHQEMYNFVILCPEFPLDLFFPQLILNGGLENRFIV